MNKVCVFQKLGSLFNRPDWRYYLFSNPFAKLNYFLREEKEADFTDTFHGSYLKRFVNRNDPSTYRNNLKLSSEGQIIFNSLSQEEKLVYQEMQYLRLRDEGLKVITYTKSNEVPKNNWAWRIKDLDGIKDDFFQRIIKHYSHVEFDENIEFAINLKFSEHHDAEFRFIGYTIYLGLSDIDIAKKFRLKIKQVEALRYMFFDFSNKPTDVVANASYLRQLVNNEVSTEVDFKFYKLINELGDVGLRARSNFYSLSTAEKKALKEYIALSSIENIFELKTAIRTGKDATAFSSVVNAFNANWLAQENISFLKAREENIRANTERVRTSISTGKGGVLTSDEETLNLMDQIYKLSMQTNAPPTLKTLDDLKISDDV